MRTVAVLGSGLVGSLIARDLAADPGLRVVAADRSAEALATLASIPNLETATADLRDAADVARVVAGADVVVGAVPGFMGTALLRTLIGLRKPIVDISFSPEDPFDLDAAAREAGVPVVVDAGVSPGLSNLAAGRAMAMLVRVDALRIFVGGLPFPRTKPWEYRIVFSATDVIEEYTRPARVVEGGRIVVKPALSEPELLEIPGVGSLEGFLTDGLRTVLRTVPAGTMFEKTLRYPGHREAVAVLRDTGLLSSEPVDVGGARISPRAMTEAMLFRSWKRPAGEREFTVLRVIAEGLEPSGPTRLVYELFDETDAATGATSMARTTGFPCALLARLVAEGRVATPGVLPLETLGRDEGLWRSLVAGLASRGIRFTERSEALPAA